MLAIDQEAHPAMQAILSGIPEEPLTRKLANRIRQYAQGNITLIFMDGQAGQRTLIEEHPALSTFRAVEGNPKVFLCKEFQIQNVATTPEMATHQIRSFLHNY
jgi:hypothetical protein